MILVNTEIVQAECAIGRQIVIFRVKWLTEKKTQKPNGIFFPFQKRENRKLDSICFEY